MLTNISEDDLPSVKFDKEIKDKIQYNKLEAYVTGNPKETEINEWIKQFKSNMQEYLVESNLGFLHNHDKRCRDLHYLIYNVKQKILSLKEYIGKKHIWKEEIENFSNNYIFSESDYKCKRILIYYNTNTKILDDFCEDSAFINDKLTNIKNSVHCPKILSAMSTRKDKLKTVRRMDMRKDKYTKIDNNCSTKFLDDIYTPFNCTPIVRSEQAPSVPIPNDNQLDSKEPSEGLKPKSPFPNGQFPATGEEVLTVPGENKENNSIGLVSLPIFGVLALSFFLYKHTPLKSKFHTYFRNNGDTPLNQNYEETEQMLSNIPNLNDMDPESMQYNISYQTL
ncbi:PIR Superfamily Protein [Plasmodium ovale wallikeri]|uniref:PIR Superfamily Protein n=1 Tax=Plasmodium ovale wallikeri TaxID=864142 RepID=A0A1A9AMZ7_PLAOA|nr:PIR Superfamily Protein [Plasmodium ovale wallikeri]SBT57579.1 PIR Superfamily Protein [Plasmodium ovale wallikeri]